MSKMNKQVITEQIVKLQNELAKLQNLLQDEPEETLCPDHPFDCLAVTQVKVFPFKEGPNLGQLKGLANIVLNDQLVICGLRIMDGVNGLYVSYPLDPLYKCDAFRLICNPLTRQLSEHIENCVLEKYQAAIA